MQVKVVKTPKPKVPFTMAYTKRGKNTTKSEVPYKQWLIPKGLKTH